MHFEVVSLFPEMVSSVGEFGVVGRAQQRELISLAVENPRDHTVDAHRTVDDRPYGGGPGMVMTIEPLRSAVKAARAADDRPVQSSLMSPQGRLLNQAAVRQLAERERLLLICGRYEGIDERLIELEVDEEFSIGDYVISGGELAAAVVIDAVTRLLPGVLGDEQSAEQDSFMNGLLDHPHYSRPELEQGLAVPPVLLSGDHAAISRWRRKQALGRTWQRRPDLLRVEALSAEDRALLDEFRREVETDDIESGDDR